MDLRRLDSSHAPPLGLIPSHLRFFRQALSADGRTLFTEAGAGDFVVWDVDSRTCIARLQAEGEVVVDADSRRIAMKKDGFWRVAEPAPVTIVRSVSLKDGAPPADGAVRGACFSRDGRWLAAVNQAGLHVYATTGGRRQFFAAEFATTGVEFLPGDRDILVVARRSLTWFRLNASDRWEASRRMALPQETFLGGSSLSTNGLLCVPDVNRGVLLFRADSGLAAGSLALTNVCAAAVSPSGAWVAASIARDIDDGPDEVVLLDRLSGARAWSKPFAARSLRFSPDNSLLAGMAAGSLRQWPVKQPDAAITTPGLTPENLPSAVVAWSPDMRWTASARDRESVALFPTGRIEDELRLTAPMPSVATWLVFSPSQRYLAVGNRDDRIDVWDFEEMRRALGTLGPGRLPEPTDSGVPSPRNPPARAVPTDPAAPTDGSGEARGRIAPRSPEARDTELDLSKYYLGSLDEDMAGTMRLEAGLRDFQPGLTSFPGRPGIRFDARGIVMLPGGEEMRNHSGLKLPDPIPIPLGRRVRRLHFLGNLNFAYPHVARGEPVASASIRYADGGRESIPFRKDIEFGDWFDNPLKSRPARSPDSEEVWYGLTAGAESGGSRIRINIYSWTNPRPAVPIVSMELTSEHAAPSLFLLGITVEP